MASLALLLPVAALVFGNERRLPRRLQVRRSSSGEMRNLLLIVLSIGLIAVAAFFAMFIAAALQNSSKEPLWGLIPTGIVYLLLFKAHREVSASR